MKGVEVKLTFRSECEGDRPQALYPPSCYGGNYRPHIVLGDPAQREAIVEHTPHRNTLTEDYLGVALWAGPDALPFGVEHVVELCLMYYPDVTYDDVHPGATFTIREGPRIVASGTVMRLIEIENANKTSDQAS